MATDTKIRITEKAAALVLEFGYNLDFIMALKKAVNPQDRSYNPETKIWTVSIEHEDRVIALAREMFENAVHEYHDENNALVTENLKTGEKAVIESLFG